MPHFTRKRIMAKEILNTSCEIKFVNYKGSVQK